MTKGHDVVHALAGVKFPSCTDLLVRGRDLTRHDDFGHNLSVAYSGVLNVAYLGVDDLPDFTATVYVYPADCTVDQAVQMAVDDIYQSSEGAIAKDHGQILIDSTEGCWVTFALPATLAQPARRSTLWLFESDGWFVKYRCSDTTELPAQDVRYAAESLIRRIGWPNTSKRLAVHQAEAHAHATMCLSALEAWSPSVNVDTQDLLNRVRRLRSQDRIEDAMAMLREALDGGVAGPGLHAELGRIHLVAGNLLDAIEQWMAELERESDEGSCLHTALKGFVAHDVVYTGGWGATPSSPVVIQGAATQSVHVNAVHRYLEFLLGQRGEDWQLYAGRIHSIDDQLLELMHVNLSTGEDITVFFAVSDQTLSTLGLPPNTIVGGFDVLHTMQEGRRVFSPNEYGQTGGLRLSKDIAHKDGVAWVLDRLGCHLSLTGLWCGGGLFGQADAAADK